MIGFGSASPYADPFVFQETFCVATLDELNPGERVRITEVEGDDGIAVRLMEMGLIDGEEIELLGRAPFGDPLEFQVRGYRVSLRSEEARRISIEPLDGV